MLSKIFLGLLAVCVLLMAFFTFYAYSWLQSIGQPSAAVAGYLYHDNIAWTLLIASSVLLLIFGNVILWMTRKAWPLWSTLLYFAAFMAIRYFWMDQQFLHFKTANGMSDVALSAAPLFGAVLIIIAAIFTFCDQFAILQLHRQMYPITADIEREIAEVPAVEDVD